MTEREILELIWQATITPDEWVRRIRTQPGYAWRSTKYGRALLAARALGRPAPAPVPPLTTDVLAPYRSLLIMGQDPLHALGNPDPKDGWPAAPSYYHIAFTADPAYDSYATRDVADRIAQRFGAPYVWYVPTEVSEARAEQVASRLNASLIIGQCETAEQFDASVAHGRKAMVGNLSALRPDQLAKVASGERIVISELYRNCNGNQRPDWKNANAGVAGNCVAVYGGGECARMPLAQYIADDMFVPHRDSLYGPGMQSKDWAVLR